MSKGGGRTGEGEVRVYGGGEDRGQGIEGEVRV